MELFEYFTKKSRELGVHLNAEGFRERKMVNPRKEKQQTGFLTRLDFEGFKIIVTFIEQGRIAYAPQTIWVNISIDACPEIPFSLYDVLSFTQPENFNCYTYTYVDSFELMDKCFAELKEILQATVSELTALLADGVLKNKLIAAQKQNIINYFGDNIFESSEMIGSAADKIIAMMLENFYEAEIETAVIGAQAVFYTGNSQKAIKMLKKSKQKTVYLNNLLTHMENGGKYNNPSAAVREASSQKGSLRHGGGFKNGIKLAGTGLLLMVPVSVALALLYTLLAFIFFKDSTFTTGYIENIFMLPCFSYPLACALALNITKKRAEKKKTKGSTHIHAPRASKTANEILKCFTIIAETLAVIGCVMCVFSITAFNDTSFSYAESDFPLSQAECDYSGVEFIGIIEGYYVEKEYVKESYAVVRTISGRTIDLYNSTWYSCKEITKNKKLFEKQGIEIKTFKTFEEYEQYKSTQQ